MAEEQYFLVGQKAFIANGKGQLLILSDPIQGLDLPGGKVQVEETNLDDALKREVKEETGFEVSVGEPFVRWYRKGTPNSKFSGEPFYMIGFHCTVISGKLRLSDEHNRYFWIDKSNFPTYKGEQGYMDAIAAYFSLKKDD